MSSIEIMNGLERRLSASIPVELIHSGMDARLKNVARTAEVPGFRPGKAPFKILEQKYGAQVQQEALQEALQRRQLRGAVRAAGRAAARGVAGLVPRPGVRRRGLDPRPDVRCRHMSRRGARRQLYRPDPRRAVAVVGGRAGRRVTTEEEAT